MGHDKRKRNDSEEESEYERKKSKDRKHKKKHKGDSSSSSSSSSDSDDKHARKKERREKKKAEKLRRKEEKRKRKAQKGEDRPLEGQKGGVGPVPSSKISSDDFYLKTTEFRIFLLQLKKIYFEDLSADDARVHFEDFIEQWNSGLLPEKMYLGLRETILDPSTRTKYQWKFAKKIDQHELATVKDAVDTDTFSRTYNTVGKSKNLPSVAPASVPLHTSSSSRSSASASASASALRTQQRPTVEEGEEMQGRHPGPLRQEVKAWRNTQKDVLEEIAPKPDVGSFQHRQAKRAEKGSYARGDRGGSPELGDRDMYGGDDFHSRLAKQKEREFAKQDRKQREYLEKKALADQKEKERMDKFREEMGLGNRFSAPTNSYL